MWVPSVVTAPTGPRTRPRPDGTWERTVARQGCGTAHQAVDATGLCVRACRATAFGAGEETGRRIAPPPHRRHRPAACHRGMPGAPAHARWGGCPAQPVPPGTTMARRLAGASWRAIGGRHQGRRPRRDGRAAVELRLPAAPRRRRADTAGRHAAEHRRRRGPIGADAGRLPTAQAAVAAGPSRVLRSSPGPRRVSPITEAGRAYHLIHAHIEIM